MNEWMNEDDECVSSCGHFSQAKGSSWDQMGAQPVSSSLALKTAPPKPQPPMAGKGTEGRGETAEKTRHTWVQPLNTGVTVKGAWKSALSPGMIYMPCCPWECAVPMHKWRGNAHISAEANTDTGVQTSRHTLLLAKLVHTYNNINTLSESAVCSCACFSFTDDSFWDRGTPDPPVDD